MPIATARYDALPARIAPHRFPHVKRILLATVIVDDSPIHRVTKLFIHTNRQRVGDAHEQIDEEAVMRLLCDLLELAHQLTREALSTISRSHRDRRDVSVPQFILPFALSHDVSRHVTLRRRRRAKVFRPRREVVQIKRQRIRLRERVSVHVVVREQVIARERTNRRHLRRFEPRR